MADRNYWQQAARSRLSRRGALGAGGALGLAADRFVIAADSDRRSPGFRSRYAQERLLYPPPESAPRELVATLLQTARDRQVDLIIFNQGATDLKASCF